MAEHLMTLGPLVNVLIVDDAVDDFINVDTASDDDIFVASGGQGAFVLTNIVTGGAVCAPIPPWIDNEMTRWDGPSPAGNVQGSDIFLDDSQNITGLNDITFVGILTGGSGSTVITNADGTVKGAAIETAFGGTALTITTGVMNLDDTAVTPASYTITSLTVDQQGRITAAASGSIDISGDTNLSATTPIVLTGDVLSHANTAVTPASYTITSLTVDAMGHITAAVSGSIDISGDTNLAVTSPIVLTDDTLSHAVSGVGAGTYTSVTVDTLGHTTGATNPGHVLGAGTGTNNTMAKWTPDGNTIGDSDVTDDGATVTVVTEDFTVTAGNAKVTAGYLTLTTGFIGIGTANQADAHAQADDLIISGSGHRGLTILSTTAAGSNLWFGDSGSNTPGRITYDNNGENLLLYSNNALGLRIDSSQNVEIPNGDFDVLSGDASINGILTLPKASGNGIKVDIASPTFGWADLIGDQFSKNVGATKPTLTTYNGAVEAWQFAAGDEAFISFHIPHDYVIGSDIFLHIHWSHTGTLVNGGTITFKITSIYAQGHNRDSFITPPVVGTFTGTASMLRYQHIISEAQYSASSPAGMQISTGALEPDGVIEMTFELDANNITVSGGAVPDPFIHFVDIHYQTTGLIGTKDKVPDFYT